MVFGSRSEVQPQAVSDREVRRVSSESDETLLALLRAGNTAAFEPIMRRYNQRLYRIARSIVRDEAEAEDVVQEAYVSAYKNLAQFADRSRFSTWLTRIAINEALARGRARRREELDPELGSRSSSAPSPEDNASRRELAQLLVSAIDALPESYRMVVMLRDVEGMDTAEVAECLDLTQEAVRVRLHRARAALRDDISKQFDDAIGEVFGFAGERCDRIVRGVYDRLQLPY